MGPKQRVENKMALYLAAQRPQLPSSGRMRPKTWYRLEIDDGGRARGLALSRVCDVERAEHPVPVDFHRLVDVLLGIGHDFLHEALIGLPCVLGVDLARAVIHE